MKSDAVALSAPRHRLFDFIALTKPRLNLLVVVTTMVAYYLGASDSTDLWRLLHTLIGTALVAGGAAALNQASERDADGLMRRTRLRPVPDGRLQPGEARRFGIVLATAGILELAVGTHLLAAGVALATLVTYAVIYTPLKRRTSFAMLIGAVPGALPAALGWAAARGNLTIEAWVLFSIVFLWQIPHFLAIAWMYRDDFERAGFSFLPVIEPGGRRTAQQVVLSVAALLPVSLAPTWIGLAGPAYLVGSAVLGVSLAVVAVQFAHHRTPRHARRLFAGSIIYLPFLWGLLVVTRVTGA